MGGSHTDQWRPLAEGDSLAPRAIEVELAKILQSQEFSSSDRSRQFLEFIVGEHLRGNNDRLKESGVGIAVFGKPPDFDPRLDSTVRTAAIRLRARLKAYYDGPGRTDTIIIAVPDGHYIPRLHLRPPAGQSQPDKTSPEPVIPIALPAPVILERASQRSPSQAQWLFDSKSPRAAAARRIAFAVFFLTIIAFLVMRFGTRAEMLTSNLLSLRMDAGKPAANDHVNQGLGGASSTAAPAWGRLFVKASSEGKSPQWITLGHDASSLAVTPDGRKVYAASPWSRILSIVHSPEGTVTTLTLPSDGGPLVMGPGGTRLYLGSMVDGVYVIDTSKDQIIGTLLRSAGSVYDLAITPDGNKLFAAMSRKGVWRVRPSTGEARQITDHGCPEHLAVDPLGRNLYVSYQCGGPNGREGHDALQVFDIETEEGSKILNGPPVVGGPLSVSPDARLMAWDGTDACENPEYDHEGCPSVPSHVIHFIRLDEPQFFKSLGLPSGTELGGFVGVRRLLFWGDSMGVMDASNYAWLEKWELGPHLRGMALQPAGGRVHVGVVLKKEILVLEAESPECAPPADGLVSYYSGDGVNGDALGGSPLTGAGNAQFGPGRVGQAFIFDGTSSYWIAPSMGHYNFGYRDSSVALYVKLADIHGEMTILDRTSPRTPTHALLAKTKDDRLVFEFTTVHGESVRLVSKTWVTETVWYHLCVTKNDNDVVLYINGIEQDRKALRTENADPSGNESMPLFFGATKERQAFLHGKLDEVLFYNRALKAAEVRRLYQLRESGACRI